MKLALGDAVQLCFHVRREFHIHDAPEVFLQHIYHQHAQLRGAEVLLLPHHVAPGDDGLDGGGVGAGAADAQLFQQVDKGGFIVAGRRLGEVLFGLYFLRVSLSPSFSSGSFTSFSRLSSIPA